MVGVCGTGRRHCSGAGAAAGSVPASLLFWGFWSPQAALAPGQRLSKTGSVLRWGSRGGGAAGTGTKGLLFPGSTGRAGGGSCPAGSAAQGTGSFSFGRRSGFSKEKRIVFPPGPAAKSREPGVLWCHGHGASARCGPVGSKHPPLTRREEGCGGPRLWLAALLTRRARGCYREVQSPE